MSNLIPEPIREWLDQQSALSFILWVAAIWATIVLMWRTMKKAIPALKNLIELSESLQHLPDWMDSVDERLDDQTETLEEVRHEVLPNNGVSMRDDLTTVSLQVEKLQAHQDKDYERLNGLEDTITRRLEQRTTARAGALPPADEQETP